MTEPTVFGDFSLFPPGVLEIILGHLKSQTIIKLMLTTSKSFGSTLSSKINWFNLVRIHFSDFYQQVIRHLPENMSHKDFNRELFRRQIMDNDENNEDDFWVIVKRCNLNSHLLAIKRETEFANDSDYSYDSDDEIKLRYRPGKNRRWDKAYYGLTFNEFSLPEVGSCDSPWQLAAKFPYFIGEVEFRNINFGNDYGDNGDRNLDIKHLRKYHGTEIVNFVSSHIVAELCILRRGKLVEPIELFRFIRNSPLNETKTSNFSPHYEYEYETWQLYLGRACKSSTRHSPEHNSFLV